jgi:hypothetical protein
VSSATMYGYQLTLLDTAKARIVPDMFADSLVNLADQSQCNLEAKQRCHAQ